MYHGLDVDLVGVVYRELIRLVVKIFLHCYLIIET